MRCLYLFYLCFTFLSIKSHAQDNVSVKHVAFKKDINSLPKNIASHIPSGYTAIDTVFGDLNKDRYRDLLLVLKRNGEDTTYEEHKRPLLLLLGQRDKSYKMAARNDNVVACISCGGMMADPYVGAKIQKGDFSIDHFGGSGQRWSETLTFRFSPKVRKWYLHKIALFSFDIARPEKGESWKVKTIKHFGRVNFERYNIKSD